MFLKSDSVLNFTCCKFSAVKSNQFIPRYRETTIHCTWTSILLLFVYIFSFPSGIALEIKTSLVTLHWIMKQNKGRRRKATWADGDLQREVQKRRAAVRGKRRLISHRESGAEHANRSARLLTLQACLFVCVYSAQCLSTCFLPRCKFSTNTITGAPDDRYE